MRLLNCILFLLGFNAYSIAQTDHKEIESAFMNYRNAILNNSGHEAVKYIDTRTVTYYSQLLGKIRTADSLELEAGSILEKYMVLMLRHRTGKSQLLAFDGKKLLEFTIDEGMVGKTSIQNATPGKVQVEGNEGMLFSANSVNNRQPLMGARKEDGQWKLDLTSLFRITTQAFEQMARQSGKSENDFVLGLIQQISGRAPSADVWRPLK
jgi:hypothetical protein